MGGWFGNFCRNLRGRGSEMGGENSQRRDNTFIAIK